jgi:predicted amidophosphoribosyltransferase
MILFKAISEFVFPSRCLYCSHPVTSDIVLCRSCFYELKWHSKQSACKRCLSLVDEDETLCLSCKRGFFYPHQLHIVMEDGLVASRIASRWIDPKVNEMIASLITIYLLEGGYSYDGILPFNKKSPSLYEQVRLLSEKTGIPYYRKNMDGRKWLIVGNLFYSHAELNLAMVKLQSYLWGEVDFLFFTKQQFL